ncbi:hypothetical protein PMNALOAF_1264 [Methylobacterium adhaesivum]|uniref:Baseplate protein J-like domain-containing protein n=1 Tax=Methylobacterium adhaesivum TaxID=333297 RepID=A0ABT8BFF8_9HYPH|nr:hypothetical protein [Methylobacterium adhaesivum]MDN3590593.1 hypothetical protein [Methylobacterium adhaesivum]GJD30021.1 hypothetical protein PMNALOAF_1264 [Methylobacterium adhaesivum]
MTYGVTPIGFARKELSVILAEIEERAIMIFGAEVIQSSQSPMGQLNGLMANLIAGTWELGEDVYSSLDADQSEGNNLDRIAKLRLLARSPDEGDLDLRRAITNLDRANIDIQDLARAVRSVPGVTYGYPFVNEKDAVDARGLPANSVSVAVVGGDDAEVAATIRRYVVPGISTSGSHVVETSVDGLCRTIRFTRPTVVPLTLKVTIRSIESPCACQPPNVLAIRDTIAAGLATCPLINGEDLTKHRIAVALSAMPNVELVAAEAMRPGGAFSPLPFGLTFGELGQVSIDSNNVAYAT